MDSVRVDQEGEIKLSNVSTRLSRRWARLDTHFEKPRKNNNGGSESFFVVPDIHCCNFAFLWSQMSDIGQVLNGLLRSRHVSFLAIVRRP